MRIYIQQNQPFSAPMRWVFDLLATNKRLVFEYVNHAENADFKVSVYTDSDVYLDLDFYRKLDINTFENLPFPSELNTPHTPKSATDYPQKTDYLTPIFYLVNCLQEYNSKEFDIHKRFQYAQSWQAQTASITENRVQRFIHLFCQNQAKFKHLATKSRESAVFLTHDIDGLYSAWKTEGLWAAKHLRIDKILHLIYLEALRRPAWFNIDTILNLHSEYDIRSTFFFLTEKGRDTEGVAHADYDVAKPKIRQLFDTILAQKSEIGLHKSALSESDFSSEFRKLPALDIKSNRYHFLKFQLPEAWQTMEKAGVQLDASLGFAEHYGFRNSYGLPFRPYDFDKKQAMNLLVTPLNIMDGTMELYMKMPTTDIAKTIISFLDNNRKDAILSILWHNREFAPFRFAAYLDIYKQVLIYLYETKMKAVTASDILSTYR